MQAAIDEIRTKIRERDWVPGDPADLVILSGETVTSAVMDRPYDRIVVHHGRVVAENGVLM